MSYEVVKVQYYNTLFLVVLTEMVKNGVMVS